jgi:mRNA (2'-O-methyladenosine-N6-)-methyltransferase
LHAGLKGKVARSNDTNFMHANCDVDVIVAEQAEYGSMDKPDEMYDLIERFCLGRRRLMLFANDKNIRPGA